MLFSLSRTKGLLLAGALGLIGLVPHLAFAQAGAQARPDATNVQMVSVADTYCRSIDNADMTGQDYYFSAADVTAKSGKVIQSHNGGNCCTAASPWNGTSCAAPLVCAAGTEAVNGSCVATAASCAAVGMTLINGACGVAAPPAPPAVNPAQYIGRIIRVINNLGNGDYYELYVDGNTSKVGVRFTAYHPEFSSNWSESYTKFLLDLNTGSTTNTVMANTSVASHVRSFWQTNYGNNVRFFVNEKGITATGSKRTNLIPWSWKYTSGNQYIPY